MREIGEGLARELASGETTLCRCWRINRLDGEVLGFTDHDRPVEFGGVTYEPETGMQGTEIASGLGLSTDNAEAAGVLRSDRISEADLLAGVYDGAEVVVRLVDWRSKGRRLVLLRGTVGEVRRGAVGFEMEILGTSTALNRPQGRVYSRLCDAELGDARCGRELGPAFRTTGTVTDLLDARRIGVAGLGGVEEGWFALGTIRWITGANRGTLASLQGHREGVLELWHAPARPVAVGDEFQVTAGCDKSAETCRAKFANLENFRGFPLMPGEDWATGWPREGDAHDGGSLFR